MYPKNFKDNKANSDHAKYRGRGYGSGGESVGAKKNSTSRASDISSSDTTASARGPPMVYNKHERPQASMPKRRSPTNYPDTRRGPSPADYLSNWRQDPPTNYRDDRRGSSSADKLTDWRHHPSKRTQHPQTGTPNWSVCALDMQSSDHPKNQFKSNYIDPDEALIAYNEKQMSILTRSEALLEHAKTDKELLDIMEQLQKEQEEVEPPVHPEFGRLV